MTQTDFYHWLAPPTFADENQSRLAGLQYVIFWGTIIVVFVFGVLTLMFQPEPWPRLLFSGLWLPVALGSLALLRRGALKIASKVYISLAWLILTLDAWLAGGVTSSAFSSYIVVIMIIGILGNLWTALFFAGLSAAMGGVLLYAGSKEILPVTPLATTPLSLWLTLTINFVVAAMLVYLENGSISNILKQTRVNETALLTTNRQLQATQVTLQERTSELTKAVEQLEIQLTERQQILESLVRSQQELRQFNLELELRVQERTNELVKMNEALTEEVSTRRQAELALQETFMLIERAKQEWEVTVDSVPQFIGLLDRQGRLKRANRTVERWNLAPVTQVREQTVHQLFHPDCTDPACPVENFWRQASQKLQQGQPWQDEADDKILGRYLQCQVEPISITPKDKQQPSDTWGVVVVQDITASKQAEERLRESEAKFRSYIEHAPLAVFISDGTGRYVEANQIALDMLGYDAPTLYEKRIPDIVPEVDHDVLFGAVAALRSVGKYEGELRQQRRDGQQIWISLRAVKINDDRFMAFCHDITARKQTEEALRESEARYRLLAENMVDVVWTMSPAGQFTYVSPSVERLRGYTAPEVLAQSPAEALTPASLQIMQAALMATMPQIEQGAQHFRLEPAAFELEQPRKDGSTVWTEALVKVLFDDCGNFSGFLGVSRDISERKRTELELARYRHHLEELVGERTVQLELANQKLQQSEAQFRQVITSISDHIYVTEITAAGEHINQYISPNVETLTGYSADKLLADWSFWSEQIIYPADRAIAAAQLAQFEQGRSSESEYRLIRADGRVIWVRDSGRVEPRNGAIIIYGVIYDITARKADEEIILRYSERLEMLREIEHGILSAQSVEAIGQVVVNRIRRIIPCSRVSIRVLNETSTEIVMAAGYDEVAGLLPPGDPIKLDQVNIPREWFEPLQAGQVLIFGEEQLKQIEVSEVRRVSIMIVPLIYHAELIGTLNLSATKTGVFSAEHQEVAQQIADQLAIAIRQTQLYEQVQRHAEELEQRVIDRTRELSALYEVTAVASQALELPAMLAQALGQVLTALRSDVGLIWLSERKAEQQFQLVAQQGLTAGEVEQVEAILTGNGLLSRVLGQNQPLVLPTLASAPLLAGASLPAGLQTFVGASIRIAGQRLGVVTIFGRLAKQFNLEDVALLSTVADQMGVALENIRLRQQAREAAVLAERERLARELHDSVTQSLYSLTLFAEGGLEQARNGQLEPVQHNLTRIGETAQQALKEMRLMVYELRPIDLEREGLVGALHQRLAAVERRAGITARLIVEDLVELPLAVEQELYGITQEALNNALKHSGATLVTVYLRRVGEEVALAIEDNGYGFDPAEVDNKGGLGLRGLRERVNKLHGVLIIRSTPGHGTTIEVRVTDY